SSERRLAQLPAVEHEHVRHVAVRRAGDGVLHGSGRVAVVDPGRVPAELVQPLLREEHGHRQRDALVRASVRTPAKRSSSTSPSATPLSTSDRASAYSSQGKTSRTTSSGSRIQKPVGSTCVRCASNASRRLCRKSDTSTSVVNRSGRSSKPRSNHDAYGLSSPRCWNASCNAFTRATEKPV